MDIEISKSKLLEYILSLADEIKIKFGCRILTVNHVFYASLQCYKKFINSNFSEQGFDEAEFSELCEIFSNVVLYDQVVEYLDFLCSRKDSYIDELLLFQVLTSSDAERRRKGLEFATADIVLKQIIDKADDELAIIFKVPEDLFSDEEEELLDDLEIIIPDLKSKEYVYQITKKVKDMQKQLSEIIFGQDNAISIFTTGCFEADFKSVIGKTNSRPKATFLFAGPPGVGKTFLAEQGAASLGVEVKRFDMSDFSESGSVIELIGTNKSYKGDKEGELTGFVKKHPKCVLIFDEIEKAHINVIHLFLQVLDAGHLRDSNSGEVIDFSQTIIIFTTNAGRKLYEGSISSNLSGISRKTILKALENDVDPKTGLGAFPAAICSRFATGNVVMFNHMEAHYLREIVKKEISDNVVCFENETGVKCEVDEDVYSCILFSEGGNVDARTMKSRSDSFFSTELYELFRLILKADSDIDVEKLEKINIKLELPKSEQIRRLFRDDSKGCVLSFGDSVLCNKLNLITEEKGYQNIIVSSVEKAKEILNNNDVEIIFCDFYSGVAYPQTSTLNVEDIESQGREFFRYVCDNTDIPLYVLSDQNHRYSDEERFSLVKEGARGIVNVEATDDLSENVSSILLCLHHQKNMDDLAKSGKAVTYETSQTISCDGKVAEIKLFDLSLITNIDAEDIDSVLSNVSKPCVKFNDIIGADGAKDELMYFISYLKNPSAFFSKGLGVPKGVLFYGPPGTGKTMLAKAMAGESDVTFIAAEGNQFLKKYYGEGEDAVHNLFATARKYAPSIIFIDEIDTIAKERKGDERSSESILTALLAEMDGFKTDARKPIFVVAATNFDVKPGSPKSLDGALLRRFDRHIYIDLPNKKERVEFINMKIKNKPVFDLSKEEIENIAVRSTGMSFAQLSSVFEFALRMAVRADKSKVDDEIFEDAFETFNYGEEKVWDSSELEKTAYHEAGHAFLCWYFGETPSYLTIVARDNHGGYMLHGDIENRGCYTKSMLINNIRTALAGRASELVFFGDDEGLTTGASSDLRKATSIAKSIICEYGMEETVGLAVIDDRELYDGVMAHKINDIINEILNNELNLAKKIISDNSIAVRKLVECLLQKNSLKSDEIDKILSSYAERNK